eukprot:evm.model.scf_331.3 EVM.evm.TU.scf_331.3   scf_331:91598-92634(+)
MQPSTSRSVVRGIAESQDQEDSFDLPSIESHAHVPSASPGSLKQLPSPLSPKLLNFVQELGHSPFSTVYHATVHGADVAVKMVSGPVSTEIMEVYNACLNKTICHPNVVSILGVHKVRHPFLDTLPTVPHIGAFPVSQDYGDNHCVWVLSAYCNSGSLETAIREGEFWEDGALDKPRMLDILFAVRDIAQAVEHLHDNGFVHAHLTPRNVLLKVCCDQVQERKTCNVDLSGLTRRICSNWHQPRKMSSRTMLHMAPELLKGEVAPGRATDVFALGVLFWELLT